MSHAILKRCADGAVTSSHRDCQGGFMVALSPHRYDSDANGTLDVDEFSVVVHQLDRV